MHIKCTTVMEMGCHSFFKKKFRLFTTKDYSAFSLLPNVIQHFHCYYPVIALLFPTVIQHFHCYYPVIALLLPSVIQHSHYYYPGIQMHAVHKNIFFKQTFKKYIYI